jgi:hypothetical protein
LADTTLAGRLAKPLQRFLAIEAASSILLLAATLIALAAANSPWREAWDHFWHQRVALEVGSLELALSLGHWVNDALMAIFFFVVGLEIKREMTIGELASRERAMLPSRRAAPPQPVGESRWRPTSRSQWPRSRFSGGGCRRGSRSSCSRSRSWTTSARSP